MATMLRLFTLLMACLLAVHALPEPLPVDFEWPRDLPTPVSPAVPSYFAKRQGTCAPHRDRIATFYTKGTNPNQITACGNKYDPSKLTVAICTQLANPKQWCGHVMNVSKKGSSKQIQVEIDDTNATCDDYGKFQLDLSPAAWKSLAGPATPTAVGTLTVDYMVQATPCY